MCLYTLIIANLERKAIHFLYICNLNKCHYTIHDLFFIQIAILHLKYTCIHIHLIMRIQYSVRFQVYDMDTAAKRLELVDQIHQLRLHQI